MVLVLLACRGPAETPTDTPEAVPPPPAGTTPVPVDPADPDAAPLPAHDRRRAPEEWEETRWGSCDGLVDPRPMDGVGDVLEALYLRHHLWISEAWYWALDDAATEDCPARTDEDVGQTLYTHYQGGCTTPTGLVWSGAAEHSLSYSCGSGGSSLSFDAVRVEGSTPALALLSFYLDGELSPQGDGWGFADDTIRFHLGLLRREAETLDDPSVPAMDGEYVYEHRAFSDYEYIYAVDGASHFATGDFCVVDRNTFVGERTARIEWGDDDCGTVFIDDVEAGPICYDPDTSEYYAP